MTSPRVEEDKREPGRLEAFSDGVFAVIITITAFGIQPPKHGTWDALGKSMPYFLVYVLSFMYVGIYWNNHHHLLRATERIDGAVMWANLHLLFWVSLVPVLTSWVGDFYGSHLPASCYGVAALGAGVAYTILVKTIVRGNGKDSRVARSLGSNYKGRLSLILYASGVGLAWVSPWIAYALYATVSGMWFIPDRRLSQATPAEAS